ncbi:hypothetical protein [Roseateles violae]|uniref:Uncharacterized protein n=1 Tax=Roseateles violae TaxID=3058042 RepID=A0ABT8DRT3_9BURK|nr:hypothetical protein [Pelomonas sp. PFR6]MDN3918841.1 hypothetical protein [Pelomonas sp. PFR6]
MNTSSKTLFVAGLIALVGSTGFVISAENAAAPKQEIVKLERVVIVGKRAAPATQVAQQQEIVKLPRVVVEGRRAPADTQLAVAKSCAPQQAMC